MTTVFGSTFGNTTSHCAPDALTDSFGWFVQFVLASLAFALLIVKRFCEPQWRRRSWLIWFYDTSKQGFGAMLVHFINVYLASTFIGDPCSWYIINFLLDSTVGLAVIFACVRSCQCLAVSYHWPSINFGEYGIPPQPQYWLVQSVVYVMIQGLQKATVAALTHWPVWLAISRSLLSPITDAKVEVVIAVLVVPFFVNALMFWIIDNFLMHRNRRDQSTIAVVSPTVLAPGDSDSPSVGVTTVMRDDRGYHSDKFMSATQAASGGSEERQRLLRRSMSVDNCVAGEVV